MSRRAVLLWLGVGLMTAWPGLYLILNGELWVGAGALLFAVTLTARGARLSRTRKGRLPAPPGPVGVRRWAVGIATAAAGLAAIAAVAAADQAVGAILAGAAAIALGYLSLWIWRSASLMELVSSSLAPAAKPAFVCAGRLAGIRGWAQSPVALGGTEGRVLAVRRPGLFGSAEVVEVSEVRVVSDEARGQVVVVTAQKHAVIAGLHPACPGELMHLLAKRTKLRAPSSEWYEE